MAQEWASYRNSKLQYHYVYFDQISAFDQVFGLRISKLYALRIHQSTVNWIREFLKDRSFVVRVRDSFSAPHPAPTGVPQGSSTPSLLYILFVLDIPEHIPVQVSHPSLADLKLSCPITSDCSHQRFQDAMNGVVEWCDRNGMQLSPGKCLVLKARPDLHNYFIGPEKLVVSDYTRDLGLVVSAKLDFGQHVLEIAESTGTLVDTIFRPLISRSSAFYLQLYL